MSVTASNITWTLDEPTHDFTVNATQTLQDGSTQALQIQMPGARYDETVTLTPSYVRPDALTNGLATIQVSDVLTYIQTQNPTTVAQIITFIVSKSGAVTPPDIARFWCEVANLQAVSAAPPQQQQPQQGNANQISG